MTWATLSIDRRFCGPPGSGNGGYTAGRLAALTGDPAEITLRRPPPLETEMRVERAGPRLLLMHGDDLIAEAQKTVVELAIPECPSLHEARRASTGYPGLDRHPFPGCFVCGPQRAADGMAVFPGPLTDGRAWAAVWSAAETADAGPADVLVWAAMDCPGGWSISATDPAATYVLGRMAGQRIRPLDAAPVISLAWLIGRAAIDVSLLALFAVQHTAMARPAFKRRWTRIVPARRGTIDLRPRRDSSAGPGVLAVAADPGGRVTGGRWARTVRGAAVFAAGWALVVATTFAIDHLDFFGLRQVRRYLRGRRSDAAGVPSSAALPLGPAPDDGRLLPGVPRDAHHDRRTSVVRPAELWLHRPVTRIGTGS